MTNELTPAENAVMSAMDNELLTLREEGATGTPEYLYGLALERTWQRAASYTDGTEVDVPEFRAAFEAVYRVRF